MILGHVRDGFPRLMLTLLGPNEPVNVEFIVDTAFDGELSLPGNILMQLQATYFTDRISRMADGSLSSQSVYMIEVMWDGQLRLTEVIKLDNPPLLGVLLMSGKFLQAEMTDGGEVSMDDL